MRTSPATAPWISSSVAEKITLLRFRLLTCLLLALTSCAGPIQESHAPLPRATEATSTSSAAAQTATPEILIVLPTARITTTPDRPTALYRQTRDCHGTLGLAAMSGLTAEQPAARHQHCPATRR